MGDPGLRAVYEAGPTGYGLCRQLRGLGLACDVVAPALIPRAAGIESGPTSAMRGAWRVCTGWVSWSRSGCPPQLRKGCGTCCEDAKR